MDFGILQRLTFYTTERSMSVTCSERLEAWNTRDFSMLRTDRKIPGINRCVIVRSGPWNAGQCSIDLGRGSRKHLEH